MDLTSVLRDEIFRPTVTIVSPGAIAATPWIIWAFLSSPKIHALTTPHVAIVIAGLLLIFITVGLLMDDLGARLETWFDKQLKDDKDYEDHEENWHKYWRVIFKQEPVGHRYLRTRVLMLKFELNTFMALVVGLLGIACLGLTGKLSPSWFLGLFIVGTLVACYLSWEAWSSTRLLSDIRREILKGVSEPPIS